MITIYHLSTSRSERIVWLMEELGLPYELKWYNRKADRLAPDSETRALHWQRYDAEPDMWVADDTLNRPYMDMAYW